ncbi:MAG TPA: FMN-binding protein [Vicinamibacterales bacterium]|nr:FMN-binding protein [Vicinamibacterales bacterium]
MTRILLVGCVLVGAAARPSAQDTTVYLTLDQAPRAVFPGAEIVRRDVPSTPALREQVKAKLGRLQPTVWEPMYVTFTARQNNQTIGYAVVVDEIGKVAPFTLIVSVTPDFKVRDVAVMVYREVRGGEITQRRFLNQYKGKRGTDPIQLDRDIVGVSGATLSVQGANRGVHKALAVLELVYR